MSHPSVTLLGGDRETPLVLDANENALGKKKSIIQSETLVIAGTHAGREASVELSSDLTILQISVEPNSVWKHTTNHKTMILYLRRGSVVVEGTRIPPHCTAFLSRIGKELVVTTESDGADFLFLSGQPLNQNVEARGSMVHETIEGIDRAYEDYKQNQMGAPWDETLTDEQWKEHVHRYPCMFGRTHTTKDDYG